MDPTKDQIKAWLKRFNHSRDWLGEKCGKTKNTVNNWLSTNIEIPSGILTLIGRLMEDDERAEEDRKKATDNTEPERFSVEVTTAEFDKINKAASAKDQLIRVWALNVLNEAAERDIRSSQVGPLQILPDPVSHVADDEVEYKPFAIPFLGAVAAGKPFAISLDETLSVAKQYPEKHFVVEINGRSGEPDFHDGERWVIDGRDCFTPKHGKPCIVSDGHGSYLKKWDRKRGVFESINPDHDDVIPGEEAKLQGYPVEKL